MTHSQKTFQYINKLLTELTKKGYKTFSHQLYNKIYFEYRIDGKMNGIITGNSSISRVEQLIKDLEELNS
jgi:hypothetical protein